MRICIFEDSGVVNFGPLVQTRPLALLRCGLGLLADKLRRYFAAGEQVGHLCRGSVAGAVAGPVNDPLWLRRAATILVNARWLPPLGAPQAKGRSWMDLLANGPYLAICQGEVAYVVLDHPQLVAVSPGTLGDCLDDWRQVLPQRQVEGRMLHWPWELLEVNGEEINRDYEWVHGTRAEEYVTDDAVYRPAGFYHIGPPDRLHIDPTARLEPLVVADTTRGPVVIGPGVRVTAFSRLEGPCVIGEGTQVHSARISGATTIGPCCRIGGEVENSIFQGYSNKAHDGYVGHSYVGAWVNLAAGTITGNLRNDYQAISLPLSGREVPTGQLKLGSLIGDHCRTGLNVTLNCGSVLGPFAQVLPTGGYPPRSIPAWHRFGPSGLKREADVERWLAAAERMMGRRGQQLTRELEQIYRTMAEESRAATDPADNPAPATEPTLKMWRASA